MELQLVFPFVTEIEDRDFMYLDEGICDLEDYEVKQNVALGGHLPADLW